MVTHGSWTSVSQMTSNPQPKCSCLSENHFLCSCIMYETTCPNVVKTPESTCPDCGARWTWASFQWVPDLKRDLKWMMALPPQLLDVSKSNSLPIRAERWCHSCAHNLFPLQPGRRKYLVVHQTIGDGFPLKPTEIGQIFMKTVLTSEKGFFPSCPTLLHFDLFPNL